MFMRAMEMLKHVKDFKRDLLKIKKNYQERISSVRENAIENKSVVGNAVMQSEKEILEKSVSEY